MEAQNLKSSILQLAFQGKLVEQHEEEGNAKELLEKIQIEKDQLIKEKKIKREKSLPELTDEQIPYDIPESWEWTRLADISINIHYGYTASAKDTGNCRLLRITDIQNNYVNWEAVPYCDVNEKDYGTYGLNNRDIMIARTGGTIGKTYIVDSLENRAVFASYLIRVVPAKEINEVFLKKFMESPLYWQQLKAGSMGTGQPNVNGTTLKKLLLPIPPLEEQKRIVAKIEEIMPYVDQYDKAYSEVEALNKKFPEDMQKSILQYAVQGKLVEQREEEGTAEELYQEIQEEKKRLIEEGKIKKTRALAEVNEDEIPFDVPESWKWVRLGQLLNKLTDGAHSTPKYTTAGIPFISVKDVSGGKIDFSNTKFISKEEHEALFKRCNPEKGDILLTKVGTTGIPVIVDIDKEFSLFVSVALLKFNNELIFSKFLQYAIKSPVVQIQAQNNTRGVGNKNWVMRDISNTVLPLPPLEEQKRIVKKIEQVLPYFKQLVK